MTRTDERRSAARCPVDFFVQEVREDRAYLHPALNISADGVYMLVSDDRRAIDPQQPMRLEFALPTGVAIRATGRVALMNDYHGQRGLAVVFTELEDDERDAIARFVAATRAAQERMRRIA